MQEKNLFSVLGQETMRKLDEVLQSTPEGQKILSEGMSRIGSGSSTSMLQTKHVCPSFVIFFYRTVDKKYSVSCSPCPKIYPAPLYQNKHQPKNFTEFNRCTFPFSYTISDSLMSSATVMKLLVNFSLFWAH